MSESDLKEKHSLGIIRGVFLIEKSPGFIDRSFSHCVIGDRNYKSLPLLWVGSRMAFVLSGLIG